MAVSYGAVVGSAAYGDEHYPQPTFTVPFIRVNSVLYVVRYDAFPTNAFLTDTQEFPANAFLVRAVGRKAVRKQVGRA